jgi:phosphatidylserine/phosphatidylglycerophosphate/cardiolipin synthase-like enzyme
MRRKILLALLVLMAASLACSTDELPALVTVPAPPTFVRELTPAGPQLGGVEIPLAVGYGYGNAFYEIYFTDPYNRNADMEEGGPDTPLVAAIDEARMSIELAGYNISLASVQNALFRAAERGVNVRIVMESDNLDNSVPENLADSGLKIVGDRREGLMHNKFVIIDRAEVWMGSMNFTTSGTYDENNNLVRIRSTKIAENYLKEFDEMFEQDYFGPDDLAETPNPQLSIDGIAVENYFSPDDNVGLRILELLQQADSSVYFMAYSFTTDDFGETLVEKAQNGLAVAGVMEESQVKSNQGTEYDRFKEAGLAVYMDGNISNMHHKVFIIDESIVIFGSYNFSASAENKNDENVIIIFDREFAAQFLTEFQRVYAEAKR